MKILKKFSLLVKIDRLIHDMTQLEDKFMCKLKNIIEIANDIKYIHERVDKIQEELDEPVKNQGIESKA